MGSGILAESDLLKVASVLQAQAKNIEDPTALGLLETLRDRLQGSQHDLADLYPVRAIGNRSIVDVERLPPSALARTLSQLEHEIEAGQLLELNRFAGVGRFELSNNGFFHAWPLQIVFHNIAWYLAYERADGPEVGLLQFEQLDYVIQQRVEQAKLMLSETDLAIRAAHRLRQRRHRHTSRLLQSKPLNPTVSAPHWYNTKIGSLNP